MSMILLLLFFSTALLYPQEKYLFETLNVTNGLSHNKVNCITQDSYGFMWCGTEHGLCKYDGYNFTTYINNPGDSGSLGGNNVLDIIEDSERALWICAGNSISRLDRRERQAGKFTNYYCAAVTDMEIDKSSADSMLWIATKNGLKHFNKKHGSFTSIQTGNLAGSTINLGTASISRILHANDSTLWVGTANCGLFRAGIKKGKIQTLLHYPGVSFNKLKNSYYGISSIYEDRAGAVWIGCNGGGLVKIKTDTWGNQNFISYNKNAVKERQIKCNYLMSSIAEDDDGNILFSSDGGGVILIDSRTQQLHSMVYNPRQQGSIGSNRVTALYLDHTGLLWVGTHDMGISKRIRRVPEFKYFPIHLKNKDIIQGKHNNVWCLKKSIRKNYYWAGMDQVLCLLEKKGERFVTRSEYTFKNSAGDLINNLQIRDIFEEQNGHLWLASLGLGLIHLNTFDGTYKLWEHTDRDETLLPSSSMYCIENTDSLLWLGVNDGNLTSFDLKTKTFNEYPLNKVEPGTAFITTIKKSRIFNHLLWLGEWNYGLLAFDMQNHSFHYFNKQPDELLEHNKNVVTAILETPNGTLWIGTYGSGLLKGVVTRSKKGPAAPVKISFKTYTRQNGLADEMIYAILQDDDGFLWLSTNRGITRFDEKTETFINFSKEDGLPEEGFNMGAGMKDNGSLCFGNCKGFYYFNPELKTTTQQSVVRLTGFKRFGKYDKTVALDDTDTINLSYRDDFFSLEFAALSYENPLKNKYAYKLEGFDKNWVYIGDKREAVYTNLSPGKYTFKVKTLNRYGVWTKNALSIAINISRPFWQAWWFYVIILGLISSVAWLLHQVSLKRALKIRETIQAALARNFHDDTGGYIASIRLIAYNLSYAGNRDRERLLHQLTSQADYLSGSIKDLLFELNPGKASLTSLIIYLKDYSDTLFGNTSIAFTINGLDKKFDKFRLTTQWRTQLIRIFKEGMNNIIKHCVDCKHVVLSISVKKNVLIIKLQDDGRGFDITQPVAGQGLKNIKKRAGELGAEIDIHSKPGHGTEIIFKGKLS